jgi:hypothetical protein
MYKMDRQAFGDRIRAMQNAKKIFNNLTEDNITKSFIAYQEILAEKKRIIMLNTKEHGNRPPGMGDFYILPRCPECGAVMNIRGLPPKGKANKFGYGSMWWCTRCIYEKFNYTTMAEEMRKLKKRTPTKEGEIKAEQFLRQGRPLPIESLSRSAFDFPPCPECGGPRRIRRLPPPGKSNRFGYKFMWYCTECIWEEFSHKFIGEELKQYLKPELKELYRTVPGHEPLLPSDKKPNLELELEPELKKEETPESDPREKSDQEGEPE